jgi:predicted RNA-binding protein with PUA-like domain
MTKNKPLSRNHWLVKTEPNEFSFQDLMRDKKTVWDGIRNFQARNNLQAMTVGDWVLVYHSVGPREIVGLAQVSHAAYDDPTDNSEGRWKVVELVPVKPFQTVVHLDTIKTIPALADIPLIRQSRLSVMPLTPDQFNQLMALGNTQL